METKTSLLTCKLGLGYRHYQAVGLLLNCALPLGFVVLTLCLVLDLFESQVDFHSVSDDDRGFPGQWEV